MNKYREKLFIVFLVLVLGLLLLVRFNYRNIPLERDEGEYAYAGSLLLHAHYPYQDAYNMKFPGSYLMYALMMKIGGENIESIRLGICAILLITALGLIGVSYMLTQNKGASVLAGVLFVALTNTMAGEGLMANAEHFVNLFMVFGVFFLLFFLKHKSSLIYLFISGVLLGSSLVMKQYGYAFCLFALLTLLVNLFGQTWLRIIKSLSVFLSALILPVAMLLAWVVYHRLWYKFLFLTIRYAFAYLGLDRGNVGKSVSQIFLSAIPIAVVVVIALAILLLSLRERKARFLLVWILFSILALSTGYYFRVHYFILAYPALAVISAYAYNRMVFKNYGGIGKAGIAIALILFFAVQKEEQFPANSTDVLKNHYRYSLFADMPVVARHIDSLIPESDRLSLFSNEPELLFYSRHIAASGYIYNYPLFELQPYAREMTEEYIQQVSSNPSRLFVYHTGALQLQNQSTYRFFETWWKRYSQNFSLIGVYYATSETGGAFLSKEQLERNDDWKNAVRVEFWMRK